MNKLGILGYGVVGKATHKGILNNVDIAIYDVALDFKFNDLADKDFVFVCIPTDSNKDIDRLIEEVKALKKINSKCRIVIRCTVPVGTCHRIEREINDKVIYIPEFLRQRFWDTDCENRPIVIGHDGVEIPEFLLKEDIVQCSISDAELLKMFSNNYASARIVFANHFYELSKKINADYSNVINLYDRVEHKDQRYIEANEELRGFGGKCLPKDLDFVINSFKEFGIDQSYFDSIKKDNSQWITTVRKS
jgi:UDPglucose 6-dehydrogenase